MDEYYKKIFDMNINGQGGWATFYYGVFSKIINDNNYKVVAEVGIGYGNHAFTILRDTNIEKLYLIDPHKEYPNDGFSSDIVNNGGFEALVKNVIKSLEQYANRYTWFRKESLKITNEEINDESLDAVFIDGDHSYDAVLADLNFWWKKVKPGGQMLGDDYESCCPEVAPAVKKFANDNNLKFDLLTKENNIYPIYRFIKP